MRLVLIILHKIGKAEQGVQCQGVGKCMVLIDTRTLQSTIETTKKSVSREWNDSKNKVADDCTDKTYRQRW